MNKILLLCLALSTASQALAANRSETTIQLIMDDSGVLVEAETAYDYKLAILGSLKGLTRKREFAKAHIDVISTTLGRTVWSGTPGDLKRNKARSLALVESIKADPARCNNLSGAFIELKSNIAALERQDYKKIYVIVFSSLIHTPVPCAEDTQITLPQAPPLGGDINEALQSSSHIRSIRFYWVSPHQKRLWEEYLKPSFKSFSIYRRTFTLMDMERSKYEISQGLTLEEK
ncbi:MAG: hypothetical protein ABW098_18750 [Candidatus Thiodiazotropha sp.]